MKFLLLLGLATRPLLPPLGFRREAGATFSYQEPVVQPAAPGLRQKK